jgi:hypothetical protein
LEKQKTKTRKERSSPIYSAKKPRSSAKHFCSVPTLSVKCTGKPAHKWKGNGRASVRMTNLKKLMLSMVYHENDVKKSNAIPVTGRGGRVVRC